MPYDIGISTGWWKIASQRGQGGDLLGMHMKIGYGATAGVNFVQIDLETTAEFFEPQLKEQVLRMQRELGMKVGLHGELGEFIALESADRKNWELSHQRLCETIKGAVDLGFVYVNFHTSESPQIYQREREIKPFGHTYQVVGPDGKPLWSFCKRSPSKHYALVNFVNSPHGIFHTHSITKEIIAEWNKKVDKMAKDKLNADYNVYLNGPEYKAIAEQLRKLVDAGQIGSQQMEAELDRRKREKYTELYQEAERWEKERLNHPTDDELLEMWERSGIDSYFIEWGEIGAYLIIADHLHRTNHPLWTNIVGSGNAEEAYRNNQFGFNAAISAFYILNHLILKDHEANKKFLGGMSIKEFAEKNNILILFESPTTAQGMEGLWRFFHPLHVYHFLKQVSSSHIKFCFDFEHTLANKINIDKLLLQLPGDFGKETKLIHMGRPVPYFGEAHVPMQIGSRDQEILYKWLFELRKKGFKDGWMIYERGGGESPLKVMEQSVVVLRLLREHLEQDILPDELPEKFYGMTESNPGRFAVQRTLIRDHAWDPLKGLIMIPEEEHTFMSKSAVEKGKAEEWKRGRYR